MLSKVEAGASVAVHAAAAVEVGSCAGSIADCRAGSSHLVNGQSRAETGHATASASSRVEGAIRWVAVASRREMEAEMLPAS
jgi:hypothetical protein